MAKVTMPGVQTLRWSIQISSLKGVIADCVINRSLQIRKIKEKTDLTFGELAVLFGVHRNTVIHWYDPAIYARRMQAQRLKWYGLTLEMYDQMLANQDYRCAICYRPNPTDIDHDHDTWPRTALGILCKSCNPGIGNLQHSPRIMDQAIKYVRRTRPRNI